MDIILLNGIGNFVITVGLFLLFGLVCYKHGVDETINKLKQKEQESKSETKAHFIEAD